MNRCTAMMRETMPPSYVRESKGEEVFLLRWDVNLASRAGYNMDKNRKVYVKRRRSPRY